MKEKLKNLWTKKNENEIKEIEEKVKNIIIKNYTNIMNELEENGIDADQIRLLIKLSTDKFECSLKQ